MDDYVHISHDSFARETLLRKVATGTAWQTCKWCGQHRYHHHKVADLFKYAKSPDDSSRTNELSGVFCSVSCMRSYHAN